MSGHNTSSDTLHQELYIECKWLKGENDAGAAVLNLWDKVVKEAKREDKLPVLAIHRRGSRVEFAAMPLPIAARALALYMESLSGENIRPGSVAWASVEAPA
jgi:hypothetical protein